MTMVVKSPLPRPSAVYIRTYSSITGDNLPVSAILSKGKAFITTVEPIHKMGRWWLYPVTVPKAKLVSLPAYCYLITTM